MRRPTAFRAGGARVIVIVAPLAQKRGRRNKRETILWSRANRRSYVGLVIGVGVGLAIFAIALLAE